MRDLQQRDIERVHSTVQTFEALKGELFFRCRDLRSAQLPTTGLCHDSNSSRCPPSLIFFQPSHEVECWSRLLYSSRFREDYHEAREQAVHWPREKSCLCVVLLSVLSLLTDYLRLDICPPKLYPPYCRLSQFRFLGSFTCTRSLTAT